MCLPMRMPLCLHAGAGLQPNVVPGQPAFTKLFLQPTTTWVVFR